MNGATVFAPLTARDGDLTRRACLDRVPARGTDLQHDRDYCERNDLRAEWSHHFALMPLAPQREALTPPSYGDHYTRPHALRALGYMK